MAGPTAVAQLLQSKAANSGPEPAAAGQENAQASKALREMRARLLASAAANPDQSFEFNSWEFEYRFGDKAVKGAPFSAQIVIESTRTLANGVHISHKMTGALYRDSEGRTRREQPREGDPEVVMIDDPVGAVSYRLNLLQRTSTRIPTIERKVQADADMKKQLEAAARKAKTEEAAQKGVSESGGTPESTVVTTEGYEKKVFAFTKSELPQRTESLGKQMIEGVQADGTRSTITIPAGKEGNDQPFDIVSESWYSADMQMTVMSKHSDPRTGDNVYRLTNINRSEPDSSLFAPPPDFSVVDLKTERRRRE
jgi:hypothetical protein